MIIDENDDHISGRETMIQFEKVQQDMRELNNMVGLLLRQSVPAEEVGQLPQGLPAQTIMDVDDVEQLLFDAGDVRTNMVGVRN